MRRQWAWVAVLCAGLSGLAIAEPQVAVSGRSISTNQVFTKVAGGAVDSNRAYANFAGSFPNSALTLGYLTNPVSTFTNGQQFLATASGTTSVPAYLLNPPTNTWAAAGTSTTGAPVARKWHTMVWSGTKAIVWGGYDGTNYLNTGGSFDPVTNSWSATTTTGAPSGRSFHSAIWTGTKMVVWGGRISGVADTNTGGQYDPSGNSWSSTSTAAGVPSARATPAVEWTGNKMLVWGGYADATLSFPNTGGVYDPAGNSWSSMTTTGAPPGRLRSGHVWTGSKMVVWGGMGVWWTNEGGQYDPAGDSWSATSTTGAPTGGRDSFTSVWTGTQMIVWGGYDGSVQLNTGAKYDPAGNSWATTTTVGAPVTRDEHTAVWNGLRMIVWGGQAGALYNDGGVYDPTGDSWSATTTVGAPSPRSGSNITLASVFGNQALLVFGGWDGANYFNTGGIYFPPCN